jgi:RNA polymerase sigma-70 factor, ECF subfamily
MSDPQQPPSRRPGGVESQAVPQPARPEGQSRADDAETAQWLQALDPANPQREAGVRRLHEMLLRVAGHEVRRRAVRLPTIQGPELDDIASQAAADAVMSILANLDTFQGDSRFTTWAYKFAVFQVGVKTGRHFWLNPPAALDATAWDRLPDRLGMGPAQATELREMVAALRRAVDDELSEQQRRIFLAVVLGGALIDTVAAELDTTRNAVYKSLFDARRKLRRALDREGFRSTVGGEA